MKKNVVLGLCGGIAVYKSCEIVSSLRKLGYDVKVVMTDHAKEFVTPLTFETISKNAVINDMFAPKPHYEVEHISLAKWAGVFLVAPATANAIAKFANGIADDMLSTSFMATEGIKVVCPAMNTKMYLSEANLANIEKLKRNGVIIIEPQSGMLACGDVGIGRMEEPSEIVKKVDELLTPNADFRGKKVLITAGATLEDIDGVRFISNRSSGKMGIALAEAAIERGGQVTIVCGKVSVPLPKNCAIKKVQ
ncbi:MAG: bifunctional phosphopantothenoylcysteine decarboxylase/phosphopantothenate--cysteine ligase CoaBC, partial [Clostridia bacterium]|nr:bifunctional phosphopantothenoylcysteine decarboxylase/phosphopantothenate--cysteine ligase CoaBC [Clostridia bacterium]